MVRSSSCKNVDAVCFLNRFDDSWLYHYLTRFICIGLDQLTHDSWLLIDFFEHVVWVSPFSNIRKVKFSRVACPFFDVSIIVLYFNAVSLDNDQLLVMDFHVLVGFTNHGHSIRANHIVTISKTDQEWWLIFRYIDGAWIFRIHQSKSIGPTDDVEGFFEGFKRRQALFFSKFSDQVGCDFCICLPLEMVTSQVFFLDFKVVFNDAIVYQNKTTCLRTVWVSIVLSWFSMSGPTGMSNSRFPFDTFCLSWQFCNATNCLYQLALAFTSQKNTCRVITSVFELFKSLNQNISSICISYNTNDSAHSLYDIVLLYFPLYLVKRPMVDFSVTVNWSSLIYQKSNHWSQYTMLLTVCQLGNSRKLV